MATLVQTRNVFRHEELSDSESHFRLLQIISVPTAVASLQEDCPGSKFVECKLTTWPMAEAPSYHAISYTWGDANSMAWIKVNGTYMRVRQNCEDMLQQVFQHESPQAYVWVDAICINQDNSSEKSRQVSKIGEIYRNAERVLACVGAHDEHSRFLIETLHQHSELFIQASTYAHQNSKMVDIANGHWQINFRDPRRLGHAFCEFLCRPYFQRVWTLQELWLARSCNILCGEDRFHAHTLHGLYWVIRWSPGYSFDRVERMLEKRNIGYGYALRSISQRLVSNSSYSLNLDLEDQFPHLESVLSAFGNQGHLKAIAKDSDDHEDLLEALDVSKLLQCENIRDRVYALISIVDWENLKSVPIQPDYDIDVYDLAIDVLHRSLKSPRELSPIRAGIMIMQCLQLGIQMTPKLARAISIRHHSHTTRLTAGATIESSLPRYVKSLRGFKLLVDNGAWKLDAPKLDAQQPEHIRHHTTQFPSHLESDDMSDSSRREATIETLTQPHRLVIDERGQPQAILPFQAQPGDWLVYAPDHFFVILRERADGKYNVIGKALGRGSLRKTSNFHGTRFNVFFDAEDLLVLCRCKKASSGHDFPGSLELISDTLGTAVCSAEGSSYAEIVPKYSDSSTI
ncbi:hypothetical protein F5Y19DRAFT_41698 [Xylariaceae sp. FL1651]|nr:hypothetical protein F5Y19DRAFT_41698 [Xylariaceae sp. FL1651]